MRYGALKFIALILTVVGWLMLVLGIIVSLLAFAVFMRNPDAVRVLLEKQGLELAVSTTTASIVALAGGIVATLVISIPVLALAETIRIAIDIEKNTREAAEALRLPQAGKGTA